MNISYSGSLSSAGQTGRARIVSSMKPGEDTAPVTSELQKTEVSENSGADELTEDRGVTSERLETPVQSGPAESLNDIYETERVRNSRSIDSFSGTDPDASPQVSVYTRNRLLNLYQMYAHTMDPHSQESFIDRMFD